MFYVVKLSIISLILFLINFIGISPVNYLDLDSTRDIPLIWSSPSFYSNDILQDSIPIYHVNVKSKDGSIIVDANTTDTFYQLPSNLTEYCDIYTASVKAFIEQYSSLVTTITEQYTGSKIIIIIHLMYYHNISDYTIDILDHVVGSKNTGSGSLIQVQFPINVRTKLLKYLCSLILTICRSVVLLTYVIVSYMVQQKIM